MVYVKLEDAWESSIVFRLSGIARTVEWTAQAVTSEEVARPDPVLQQQPRHHHTRCGRRPGTQAIITLSCISESLPQLVLEVLKLESNLIQRAQTEVRLEHSGLTGVYPSHKN